MQRQSAEESIGGFDRLPKDETVFEFLCGKLDSIAAFYGFEKVATSLLEDTRLFAPAIKAGLFEEHPPLFCRIRAGTEYLLRPSGSLSLLRAYRSHKMNDLPHLLKLRFQGDVFSLDSARGKRVLSRTEWGLEVVGVESPVAEAEMAQVIWKALGESGMGLENVEMRVNAVGCVECRGSFRSQFNPYLRGRAGRLCKDCKRSMKRVPTRVLVCQEEKCRMVANSAPQVLDFLCDACKKHLRGFLELLDEAGIPYRLDPRFFRDGSWFSVLVFGIGLKPVSSGDEEGKKAPAEPLFFAEGGRVSRAGELICGKKLDAAAVSIFSDSFSRALNRSGVSLPPAASPKVFLVQLGELAKRKSLALLEILRKDGIEVQELLGRDSVKSQLKVAELSGAEVALILGQKEALDGTIIVREVQSGIQETMPQGKLVEFLKRKLKK